MMVLSPLRGYFGRNRAAVSAGAFKFAFSALVIAAAFGVTYAESESLSSFDVRAILALGAVVNAILLLGSLFALRSKLAANTALSLVTLGGVFTAYIVHTELFFPENRVALIAICGAALFALFVAFRVIDELRWGGVVISAAALIGFGLVGTPVVSQVFRQAASWAYGASQRIVAPAPISVEQAHIRPITFEETPNVYFVGFDAMVPQSIMEKYLGMESTEFHDVFDSEARRFRNFFTNAVSTTHSYNMLMSLHEEVFFGYLRWFRGDLHFFAGYQPSPLLRIMRENGYETTAIYDNVHFGYPGGPYIDNLIVNNTQSEGVCSVLDENVRRLAFWGYCGVAGYVARDGDIIPKGDFLVRQLTGLSGRQPPQFAIAHLYMPGHTKRDFSYQIDQLDEFKSYYRRESNRAAVYLRQIIEHVKTRDPDAILFVFGDHGMWLSRGMEPEEDPMLFVQDRYGILGGVYPRDRCAEHFDEAQSRGYIMTTLDAVHAILSCLSGGQSALVEPRRNRLWGDEVPPGWEDGYKEFRYE